MSSLAITTIQSSLFWENKEENLKMFEKKLGLIDGAKELVVLPEMFSTGFSMNPGVLGESMEGSTVGWMKDMAKRHRIILTGSIIIKEEERYFNRLLWVLPNGQLGYYDKRHLFAYAGEDQHFDFGNKRFIASVKGWKICLQICYDLRFPVWARQQQKLEKEQLVPEYDILINVANWPDKRSAAWKTLLAARAIENQCYVVGVNRVGYDGNEIYHSGNTSVIDPLGTILYSCSDKEDINTLVLKKDELEEIRNRLPFLGDADSFAIID
jgi:omega-amidase